MKSGNLNYLEPSGPLQAYNGTALHSGNLNYLEPSGPLQACNGTALHSGNLNYLEPSGPLQAYNGTALHFQLFNLKAINPHKISAVKFVEGEKNIEKNNAK